MSLLKKTQSQQGQLLVSYLVVARLVPTTIFAFAGGILADTRDRRCVMVVLDVLGAIVALGYLRAHSSMTLLYICAIAQATLSGLYHPSKSAILPLLVAPEYLEKANEISSIVWSLSAAVGSSIGGFVVNNFGTAACFGTDSLMYLLSAGILAIKVQGDYCVGKENARVSGETLLEEVKTFLRNNTAAPFLLVKLLGALTFGASDVINVSFSQVSGSLDSQRLGWMFASVGAGCLLGPLMMPAGRSYVHTFIGAYIVLGLGYSLIGLSVAFWPKCVWTVLRAAGAAVLWVDSTILIQNATPSTVLGRISSIDFALATLGESTSAVIAGLLQDNGLSANSVALVLGGMGFMFACAWIVAISFRRPSLSIKEDPTSLELEPLQDPNSV